jgi:hypothetical protein
VEKMFFSPFAVTLLVFGAGTKLMVSVSNLTIIFFRFKTKINITLDVQVITQRMPEAVVRGERNASVKQLRLRLASVKSIQRITKVVIALDCLFILYS